MHQRWLWSVALLMAPAVWAGSDKESYSTVPGLFFARLTPANEPWVTVVNFDNRLAHQRFVDHCASGRPVYRYRSNQRYSCKADWYPPHPPDDPGEWRSAGITVSGPYTPSDRKQSGMFSLQPTPTTRWQVRALTVQEHSELQRFVARHATRLQLPKRLPLRGAVAVGRSHSPWQTWIVPGYRVQHQGTGYDARRHHVFVQHAGRIRYQGMLRDKPEDFFDVDGDDLPEVLTNEQCDGLCISLWSVDKGMREVAHFGGH